MSQNPIQLLSMHAFAYILLQDTQLYFGGLGPKAHINE